jgi:hypothetical protein
MTDDSFASRWSRRKQAVKDEELSEEAEAVAEEVPKEPEQTEAEVLAEFNLKDPDEMQAGDDFSAFMNSAIPQRLRNRALRKLWLSNPALANLDELLDYGEDFTNKGGVVEDIVTAYKVGKGFVDKLAGDGAAEAESIGASPEDDSGEGGDPAETDVAAPVENVRKPEDVRVQAPLPVESKLVVTAEIAPKAAETPRKRMRFTF